VTYGQAQNELTHELRVLVERAHATNAFVFDAWGIIWCSATLTFGEDETLLYAQVPEVLEAVDPPLARGGKLDRIFAHAMFPMYCVSFAATYVLGLWLTPKVNEFEMRRLVKKALPRVEAMTLSLPPPNGPDMSSGAKRSKA
jgi:hypothetical protein